MPLLAWLQDFTQELRRIAFSQPAADRILEHARAVRSLPVRDLDRAAALDGPDGIEYIRRLHLVDRQVSEGRKDVGLEALQDFLRGLRLPLVGHGPVPVVRDVLEGILLGQSCLARTLRPGVSRVGAGRQQLTRFVPPGSSVHERNVREGAETQSVHFAIRLPEFHSPELPAAGHDFEVQAAAIGKLVGFVLRLGVAHLQPGQGLYLFGHFGGILSDRARYAPKTAPKSTSYPGATLDSIRQQKTRRLYENSGFFDVPKPTWTMFWRRRWDSNPRYRFKPVCFLSREVPSAARPRLQSASTFMRQR